MWKPKIVSIIKLADVQLPCTTTAILTSITLILLDSRQSAREFKYTVIPRSGFLYELIALTQFL